MVASPLGPDWALGGDGMYFRRAARVILLDERNRVLLVRGHDADQPERSWWFTLGGGIEPGEEPRDAAVREVREETGIVLDPAGLIGPVLTREAVFDFYRVTCRQDEVFFVDRLSEPARPLDLTGLTALERDVLDEHRWWDAADLRRVEIEVFPVGLADFVQTLAGGWNGRTLHLGRELDG